MDQEIIDDNAYILASDTKVDRQKASDLYKEDKKRLITTAKNYLRINWKIKDQVTSH